MNRSIHIADVSLQLPHANEAEEIISGFIRDAKLHHIVTVNPEYIVEAVKNKQFKSTLMSADLATADGAGIIIMAKILGYHVSLSQRLTGVTLTRRLLSYAEKNDFEVLIVLRHDSLTQPELLSPVLHHEYPNLSVHIGVHPITIENYKDTKPVFLFACHGSPEQDLWIAEHKEDFSTVRIAIGVGGTFDFISGRIKRAPQFLRTIGLEWLWRFVREPKRLKRIVRAVIIFPYLALKHR